MQSSRLSWLNSGSLSSTTIRDLPLISLCRPYRKSLASASFFIVQVAQARLLYTTLSVPPFVVKSRLSFVLHPLASPLFFSKEAAQFTPPSRFPSRSMNPLPVVSRRTLIWQISSARLIWSFGMKPQYSTVTSMMQSTGPSRIFGIQMLFLVVFQLSLVVTSSRSSQSLRRVPELKLWGHVFRDPTSGPLSRFFIFTRTCA